ncbi:DUF3793 family protein [Desulfuribacillus alkaliarsenatis]|uniref:DUF3793 domain-containing protein n=1 Tax=Desulfuribacillus alkaliarsenatis TaxID=766136 RepID=A0A1E5G150_9FIRM|nr:DUF3793 family protein [Desulfuribacillus alkaliarsenatis]OEF96623.1 hypothetical protein BHF68_08245 [Desulfuribacillus alkaliarsenatis]
MYIQANYQKGTTEQLDRIVNAFQEQSYCTGYAIDLVERIGATIMGVKPAELLNVPLVKIDDNFQWEQCKHCLLLHKELRYREITSNSKRMKVFFYHREQLDQTLRQKTSLKFLQSLGYPDDYSLEAYLDILVERIKGEEFPDEIGLFLGYPLKDVLGFTGRFPLKLIKTQGWKYYGTEKISKMRYESFHAARAIVKQQIKSIPS